MAQFRDYLEQEGIDTEEREIVRFETRTDDRFVGEGLQVIRPESTTSYEAQDDIALAIDDEVVPTIDLTPQMEALVSEGAIHETPGTYDAETNRSIDAGLIPLLSWQRLYRTCWRYREKEGYTNLTFSASDLQSVIEEEHYVLHCPEEMIGCERLDDLSQIESIVLRILRTYITEFYSDRKQAWERETMQYEELTEDDDNLVSVVEARVKSSAQTFPFLDNLLARLQRVETEEDQQFLFVGDDDLYRTGSQDPIEDPPPRVYFEKHLYHPLVTQEDDVVKYSPPGLNTGERTRASA